MQFINEQFLYGINRYILNRFQCESVNKKFFRLFFIKPTAFEVKYLIFFQLAYCCTVGTNYIISKNLELRLGIDQALAGKQKVSVLLERVNLLSILSYKNLAVKYGVGLAVNHAFMKLVALTMRKPVIHNRMSVRNLVSVNKNQPVNGKLYFFLKLGNAWLVSG